MESGKCLSSLKPSRLLETLTEALDMWVICLDIIRKGEYTPDLSLKSTLPTANDILVCIDAKPSADLHTLSVEARRNARIKFAHLVTFWQEEDEEA